MTLIAIVEDEALISGIVDSYLKREGYDTQCFADGLEAESWLSSNEADLIILDLMLPGMDGLTLCRKVRATSETPIIMVTARVEEVDRLIGLELGADDYLCKPFSPRELVARVRAVLRRAGPRTAGASSSPLQIHEDSYSALLNGARLDLTPTEFRLLAALGRRPGRVLSRAQLLDALGGDKNRDVFDRSIDSHVKNLRRKMGAAAKGEDMIKAIYGVGYRLDLPA